MQTKKNRIILISWHSNCVDSFPKILAKLHREHDGKTTIPSSIEGSPNIPLAIPKPWWSQCTKILSNNSEFQSPIIPEYSQELWMIINILDGIIDYQIPELYWFSIIFHYHLIISNNGIWWKTNTITIPFRHWCHWDPGCPVGWLHEVRQQRDEVSGPHVDDLDNRFQWSREHGHVMAISMEKKCENHWETIYMVEWFRMRKIAGFCGICGIPECSWDNGLTSSDLRPSNGWENGCTNDHGLNKGHRLKITLTRVHYPSWLVLQNVGLSSASASVSKLAEIPTAQERPATLAVSRKNSTGKYRGELKSNKSGLIWQLFHVVSSLFGYDILWYPQPVDPKHQNIGMPSGSPHPRAVALRRKGRSKNRRGHVGIDGTIRGLRLRLLSTPLG